MSNINKHTGENISGIKPIWWVYASDVDEMIVDIRLLHADITLAQDKSWNFLYATDETIELDSDIQEADAGKLFIYKLRCLVPQDRADVELILMAMADRGLILHVTDKNGIIRILGTTDTPMTMSYKLKKPGNTEGYNGWEVVFQGALPNPACFGDAL